MHDPVWWLDVVSLGEALPALSARSLLHAGPPYRTAPPAPVRNAAAQAILFEGAAGNIDEALSLLDRGEFRLAPAQDHGVVTPLAQVVSHSMPVFVVGDRERRRYAPIVEGPPPALRFGSAAPLCIERLRRWSQEFAPALATLVRNAPLPLTPVITQALAQGDECHARTGVANGALVAALAGMPATLRREMLENAGFVLPILMAAASWNLGAPGSPFSAIGGNGMEFGLKLAGQDGRWRAVPADPPSGPRLPGKEAFTPQGAIGDSAVLDASGLGGQALGCAPALVEEWRAWLPPDASDRATTVMHRNRNWLDPGKIAMSRLAPIINLAVIDRAGHQGLIGRGFYLPPPALFDSREH